MTARTCAGTRLGWPPHPPMAIEAKSKHNLTGSTYLREAIPKAFLPTGHREPEAGQVTCGIQEASGPSSDAPTIAGTGGSWLPHSPTFVEAQAKQNFLEETNHRGIIPKAFFAPTGHRELQTVQILVEA